jgi:hypothetical protein
MRQMEEKVGRNETSRYRSQTCGHEDGRCIQGKGVEMEHRIYNREAARRQDHRVWIRVQFSQCSAVKCKLRDVVSDRVSSRRVV